MSGAYNGLQASYTAILERYHEHASIIQALQHTLLQDIIPDVLDEVGANNILYDNLESINQWARDSGYVFRMLKRHKFTTPFTIQALRSSLAWRLTSLSVYLSSMNHPQTSGVIRLLPRTCHDPFNRPIAVFNLAAFLSKSLDNAKDFILLIAENLRLYLHVLNEMGGSDHPILQCVVIVDVEGASWTNSGPDILNWYFHDVQPHFPGMIAAVFIHGHSWFNSQMWNIIRHILPSSAQEKVRFCSREELIKYFGSEKLPEAYGGTLEEIVDTLPDPLARPINASSSRSHGKKSLFLPAAASSCTSVVVPRPLLPPLQNAAGPHSPANPYFGYPISPTSMHPRHGRRRKRDLFMTLALLWWTKWKKTIFWWILAGVVLWFTRKRASNLLRIRARGRLEFAKSKLYSRQLTEPAANNVRLWR